VVPHYAALRASPLATICRAAGAGLVDSAKASKAYRTKVDYNNAFALRCNPDNFARFIALPRKRSAYDSGLRSRISAKDAL